MCSRIADIPVPPECGDMIRTGALVAVNTGGGKDSPAMTILLSRIVPHAQLVAVHAPLGEVEWHGGAYREHDVAGCAAHSGPHHVLEGSTRKHRGAEPVPGFEQEVLHVGS